MPFIKIWNLKFKKMILLTLASPKASSQVKSKQIWARSVGEELKKTPMKENPDKWEYMVCLQVRRFFVIKNVSSFQLDL